MLTAIAFQFFVSALVDLRVIAPVELPLSGWTDLKIGPPSAKARALVSADLGHKGVSLRAFELVLKGVLGRKIG
jgi:hypothetical protein